MAEGAGGTQGGTKVLIYAIPKGITADDRLRVTVQIVPSADFPVWATNIADLVRKAVPVFSVRAAGPGAGAPLRLHTGSAGDLGKCANAHAWPRVFGRCTAAGARKLEGEPSVIPLPTALASKLLGGFAAQSAHLFKAHAGMQRAQGLAPIRPVVPAASLLRGRSYAPASIPDADAAGKLGNTLAAIQAWFVPIDVPSSEYRYFKQQHSLIRQAGSGPAAPTPLAARVMAAYSNATVETSGAGRADVFREANPLGLTRAAFDALDKAALRNDLIDAASAALPADDQARQCAAFALRFVAAMAPAAPSKADAATGPGALAAGDESGANCLAAVGQAFALQPLLGLVSDLELDLSRARAGSTELQRVLEQDFDLLVELQNPDPALGGPDTQWVGAKRSGQLRARETADPVKARLFKLADCSLSNLEVHGNWTKLVGAALSLRNNCDPVIRNARTIGMQAYEPPTFSSGPLRLYRAGHAASLQQASSTDPGQRAWLAEDLAIGIRPDVLTSCDGGQAAWRPLLDRTVSYGMTGPAPAPGAYADPSRAEGYVPLARFAAAVDEQTMRTEDDLFTWSGWNPAVPHPGNRQAKQDDANPLCEHIEAKRGANPRFRYGRTVKARARLVLRDGSSCLTSEVTLAPDAEEAYVVGDGQGGKPYKLRRIEPLKAPAVLHADVPSHVAWLPDETVARVVLGSASAAGLPSKQRSVRYVIPGAVKDISEMDRHGVFEHGARPTDTALGDYQRAADPKDGIFPTVAGGEPVLRPLAPFAQPPAAGSGHFPYHPDPLVTHVTLFLVRRNARGELVPVMHGKEQCKFTHAFYPRQLRWPFAQPLRLEFAAARADAAEFPLRYMREDGEGRMIVRVPQGESFEVLLIARGAIADLREKHVLGDDFSGDGYFGENGRDEDLAVPMLAEESIISVEHFVDIPALARLRVGIDPANPPRFGSTRRTLALDCDATPGSTGALDVYAQWRDPVDDPAAGPPREFPGECGGGADCAGARMHVYSLAKSMDALALLALDSAAGNQVKRGPVAVYPLADEPLGAGAAPQRTGVIQEFADTKHHRVAYFVTATSKVATAVRDHGGAFSATGDGLLLNILATAPPKAPLLRDVLPAFHFERRRWLNGAYSERQVQVTMTLERGWWSSGPGELLALVLADETARPAAVFDADPAHAQAASFWGADPTQKSAAPATFLERQHIQSTPERCAATAQAPANLVLYKPRYDAQADAWTVNIGLDVPSGVPQPFVRFAVARYQPNAIAGASTSAIVLADFIQLPSKRSASIVIRPDKPSDIRVTVTGPRGDERAQAMSSYLFAYAETSYDSEPRPGIWQQAGKRVRLAPFAAPADAQGWTGLLEVPLQSLRGRLRVRIVEMPLVNEGAALADELVTEGPLYYLDQLECAYPEPMASP